MRRSLPIAGAALLAAMACSSARAEPSADDILKASGFLDKKDTRAGLVVQLGCGEGKLGAALLEKEAVAAGDSMIVQGLDTDAKNVEHARARVQSLKLGGNVSAEVFDGRRLPYADNLVNLVIAEDLGKVATSEVMRVLRPGGVAYVHQKGTWTKTVKPWPDEIDEWTHYLHGPDNNAVAQDTVVGPPRHFQWISKPRFSRSHDHLASVSAVVSSGGRLFYIVDEGSTAFAAATPRWRLVARDAFNGIRLWERKISSWEYHLRDFRSGPADIARRLVAVGDRVYVTLGYGQPASALDAATGETVRTYAGTEGTQEILYNDGTLLLVLGEPQKDWPAEKAKQIVSERDYSPPVEKDTPPACNKRIMAVAAESGEVLWKNSQPDTREVMPSTLAASAGRVYFETADAVICLDAKTGQLQWKTPRPVQRQRLAWSTPTLVVHDGVVYSADRGGAEKEGQLLWIPSGGYHQYLRSEEAKGELIALSGETGQRLWSSTAYEGFNAPVDVMITDGLLWTGRFTWGNDPGITEARDPKTGEVRRERPPDQTFLPHIGHARCHRMKATTKYLIMGRRGVEFIDLESGNMVPNLWVRGICQYGVMPANGLLYVPPHSCACSENDLLKSGFMALAPEEESRVESPEARAGARLERGPAFGGQRKGLATVNPQPSTLNLSSDWPTYRHDAARSGAISAPVSHKLRPVWETDLGGELTSPVVAGGVLLVAAKDAHLVHALDAATGRKLWTYAAGARIDSPPTILCKESRALFGSADGRVYCLRLEDGKLVWKFHAAPGDRQIVADGQLESAWPVSGNVLVVDGAAYFAVGRSSHLDGGMSLYKLDAASGQELNVLKFDGQEKQQKKADRGAASVDYLPDVLSADGESIFMRGARFSRDLVREKDNVPHLWSSAGLLDDNWWHRSYWQVGTSMSSGWGGWPKAGQQVPAGRLLVTDGSRVFGFGRNQYDIPGAHVGIDAAGVWGPIGAQQGRWTFYQLFGKTLDTRAAKQSRREPEKPAASQSDWTRRVPVLGQAMVLAGETLLVAGPLDAVSEIPHEPAEVDPLAAALESKRGGRLLAVSVTDGKTLADYELKSPPVFDGMAAAQGRLYLATKIGEVICMGPAR